MRYRIEKRDNGLVAFDTVLGVYVSACGLDTPDLWATAEAAQADLSACEMGLNSQEREAMERAQRNFDAVYGSQIREARSRYHILDNEGTVQAWTDDAQEAALFLTLFPDGRIIDRHA